MNESLNAAQQAWTGYLLVCVTALAFLLPVSETNKYVLAQKELLLLKSLELTSYEAYVSQQIDDRFWNPEGEYPRTKLNVLFPTGGFHINCPSQDFDCMAVHSQAEGTRILKARLARIAGRHGIALLPGIDLSAHALFPSYTTPLGVSTSIETWVNHHHDLHVLKPDIDQFFVSLDRALGTTSRKTDGGRLTLIGLRCDPLDPGIIKHAQLRQLAGVSRSSVPGITLPEFGSAGESAKQPRIGHPCRGYLRDSKGYRSDREVAFNVVGPVVLLDWYGPHDWLDKNIKWAELQKDWRAAAATSFGNRPLFDDQGFLPHTRKLWINLRSMTVDQAIDWLEARQEQEKSILKLFDITVTATTAMLVLPAAILMLLINLNAALVASINLSIGSAELRTSSWVLLQGRLGYYVVGGLTLLILPIAVDALLLREAVLRAAGTLTIEQGIEVWKGAMQWVDAPPYWRVKAVAAAETIENMQLPLMVTGISAAASFVFGVLALTKIRQLRSALPAPTR